MILYAVSTMGILLSISIFLYPTFINVVQYVNESVGSYLISICYKKVIIALLLSSLGAILIGYFIARNSMNRVQEFANKMENITANSLHDRINPNDWPKELKALGIKFNNMLDRLESSFKQLSQFSSDIAHELRSPIHNLRGITELALAKKRTADEYVNLLESSHEEYEHLTKLIENLFFLAHADHGQIVLNKTSLNAQAEILKISDYFSAMAEEKNIEISCEGNAVIHVDSVLFRRVLNNIFSNAIKYTPHNGKISIEIQHKENIQIVVNDTGVGIEEEHLSKIFDRFYRTDSSRASHAGSLGLGLAIAKSIMELHQGKISIESQIGKGSSVYLQLPNSG